MALSWARIWQVVLTIAFVVVSAVGYAQVDASALMRAQRQGQQGLGPNGMGGYGQNPYNTGQQGADGQQVDENGNPINGENADSTKKKRPRKPLESYFFSDSIRALRNFMWHIDRDYNTVKVEPIDTTLNVWRLDYPHYHKRLGNNSVGKLKIPEAPLL